MCTADSTTCSSRLLFTANGCLVALALGWCLAIDSAYAGASLAGDLDVPANASTFIDLNAEVKRIVVDEDQVVDFKCNGKEFAVRFDGIFPAFDLRELAPTGTLDHRVEVYVKFLPFYHGS